MNKWIYYGSQSGPVISTSGAWMIGKPSLWTTPTDIPASEAAALKAFYDATGGADWTNNTSWGTSATAAAYYGVTVTAGHVTGLALPNNNLIGDAGATLPTTLTSLDLGQNTGLDDINVSILTACVTYDLAGCEFGQAVVSGILADLVTAGVTSATVDIGGSNEDPATLDDSITLQQAGCTVTLASDFVVIMNLETGYIEFITMDGEGVLL